MSPRQPQRLTSPAPPYPLVSAKIRGLQSSVYSSKFRILQALSFHTLPKTAGVYPFSSQFGTRLLLPSCPASTASAWGACPFVRAVKCEPSTLNRFVFSLFSTTYSSGNLQVICFQIFATVGGGVGGHFPISIFYFQPARRCPTSGQLTNRIWFKDQTVIKAVYSVDAGNGP